MRVAVMVQLLQPPTFVNQGEAATFNQLSSLAQEPWAYGAISLWVIFLTWR